VTNLDQIVAELIRPLATYGARGCVALRAIRFTTNRINEINRITDRRSHLRFLLNALSWVIPTSAGGRRRCLGRKIITLSAVVGLITLKTRGRTEARTPLASWSSIR